MNNVNLVGRLTRDPELRYTNDGKPVCNFDLAVDDPFAKEDRADFIKITVWGKQAESSAKYLSKGLMTGVSGRIRSDSYTDADGVKRYPVSIVADRVQFLQWKEKEQAHDKPEDEKKKQDDDRVPFDGELARARDESRHDEREAVNTGMADEEIEM